MCETEEKEQCKQRCHITSSAAVSVQCSVKIPELLPTKAITRSGGVEGGGVGGIITLIHDPLHANVPAQGTRNSNPLWHCAALLYVLELLFMCCSKKKKKVHKTDNSVC